MTTFVAMDDTDMKGTRGTGKLARSVARAIGEHYPIERVTRHQLFVHEAIPFTSHNSCAVIHVGTDDPAAGRDLFRMSEEMMLDDFIEGSDPGLAVALESRITPAAVAFGCDAKHKVITQDRARLLAKNSGILLKGLGGTEDGVIGCMAGVGLSSTMNDGRIVMKGNIRDLKGPQEASMILESGVDQIWTTDGRSVSEGMVFTKEGKSVKSNLIGGNAVLFVQECEGGYSPVKRN